jgi:hypothetical protein
MQAHDVKWSAETSYAPKGGDFEIVDVPEMGVLMIDGHGDPNTSAASRSGPGRTRHHRGVLQRGMVLAACILGADLAGCGSGHTSTKVSDQLETVRTTAAHSVVPRQVDTLAPLPADRSVGVDATKLIAVLSQDPATKDFVQGLHVRLELGLYSNQRLMDASGVPADQVPSYVFSGGQGPCPPPAGGMSGDSSSTPVPLCAGIVIVNADTGIQQLLWTSPL